MWGRDALSVSPSDGVDGCRRRRARGKTEDEAARDEGKQPRSKVGAETYENLLWGHKHLSRPFRLGSEAGIARLRAVGLDESATCSVAVERQTRHLVVEYEPALEGLSFTRRNNQSGVRARRVDVQLGRTLRRP